MVLCVAGGWLCMAYSTNDLDPMTSFYETKQLLRLGEGLEAKYQLLLDAQQQQPQQQLAPALRARAAGLAQVEADLCQTLQALALLLAAPPLTAALCPAGTKRLQRAWFQRESSKTRGQPPPPLPPVKGLALVADGLAAASERLIVLSSALTSAAGAASHEQGIVDAAPLLATTRLLVGAEALLAQLDGTRAALDAAAASAAAAAAAAAGAGAGAAEGKGGKEEEPPDLVAAYRETDAEAVAGLPAAVDEWAGGQRPVVDLLAAPRSSQVAGAAAVRRGRPLARLHPVAAMDAAFQWTVGTLPVLAKAAGEGGAVGPISSVAGAAAGSGMKRGRGEGKDGAVSAGAAARAPVDPRAKRSRRAAEVEADAMAVEEGGLASPEWGEDEEDSMGVDDEGEDGGDGTPVLGADEE